MYLFILISDNAGTPKIESLSLSASSGRHFFISYSRTDTTQKQNIIKQLRARGINLWILRIWCLAARPGNARSSATRNAAGIIVLLSPDSNNSEWVRREISFAQQNDKQIFPVLIRGEEDDSVPLRLSNYQWVDLRIHSDSGLDDLADALKDQLASLWSTRKWNCRGPYSDHRTI